MTSLKKARLIVKRTKENGDFYCGWREMQCDIGKENACPVKDVCSSVWGTYEDRYLAALAYIRKHDRRKRVRQITLSVIAWLLLSYLGCAIATDYLAWPVHPVSTLRVAGYVLYAAALCIGIIPIFLDRPRGEEDV